MRRGSAEGPGDTGWWKLGGWVGHARVWRVGLRAATYPSTRYLGAQSAPLTLTRLTPVSLRPRSSIAEARHDSSRVSLEVLRLFAVVGTWPGAGAGEGRREAEPDADSGNGRGEG